MKYSKPPLTIENQIELLKERGLCISDEDRASRYLKNISYYHLSAYFKFYQNSEDIFEDEVDFEDVLNLYIFDKKLRLLLMDILERIEKSFKCHLAYELAIRNNDAHWILDKDLFINQGRYNQIVASSLNKDVKKSIELCVQHYYRTYETPIYPPVWIVMEILAFGSCVFIFRQLKAKWQKVVSRDYLTGEKFFINWIHGLSKIRNICAHHSRLWNANVNFKLRQNHKEYEKFFENSHAKHNSYTPLFDYLVVMQIIHCSFNPKSQWLDRLESMIGEHKIKISHMGFPQDWKSRLEEISNS